MPERQLPRQDPASEPDLRHRSVARVLVLFWAPVVVVFGAGAAVLQSLGPPAPPVIASASPLSSVEKAPVAPSVGPHLSPPAETATAALDPAPVPGRVTAVTTPVDAVTGPAGPASPTPASPAPGAAIPLPDKALLEASNAYEGKMLPRIGIDGRTPMQVYAAGFDPADKRPRIALLMGGMGMSEPESQAAISGTPAAVSLAISPYAAQPQKVRDEAAARGHESFVSIPMEPQNFPVNDAGNHALLTGDPAPANALRLDWALSRLSGYVGATGALGRLHGERYATTSQMNTVLDELGKRGLMYIDPRPGVPAAAPRPGLPANRAVDAVIDAPPAAAAIDAKLAVLEQMARDRGAALGLVDGPAPVTIARIAAWSTTLSQRGFALVPVSALVHVGLPSNSIPMAINNSSATPRPSGAR